MNVEGRSEADLSRLTWCSLIITVAVSALSLTGWALESTLLAAIKEDYIPIAPSTAICFFIASFPFLIYIFIPSTLFRTITAFCASLTILIASILFLSFFMGIIIEAEHLGFAQPHLPALPRGGHMSPVTEIMFMVASTGVLLLCLPARRKQLIKNIASFAGLSVSGAGFIMLLGYLHGTPLLYGGTIIPVAFPTAVAFIFLGLGIILAAGSSVPAVRIFVGSSMRSRLTRTFLPVAVAFVILSDLIGKLDLVLPFNTALVSSLTAILSAVIVGVIIVKISKSVGSEVDRANRDRDEKTIALQESEERFRAAMEATDDGLWDWDVAADNSYFSPAYYRMLGYEPNEFAMTFQSWAGLIHPDDRQPALSIHQDCVENRRQSFRVEYRIKAKDGAWKWIVGRGRAFSRDAQGRALRMISTHIDITDRKKAEETLRETKELLDKTFSSMNDAIFIIKYGTGTIINCNPVAERMFGYKDKELLGKGTACLHVDKKMQERFHKAMFPVLDEGKVFHSEYRMKRKDGSTFFSENTVTGIFDGSGKTIMGVLVVRDITNRKKREEELVRAQKLESVGVLAGGIAHDFNNLLTVILGYISLAKETESKNDIVEFLTEAENAALKSKELTHQLITFSKGGAPVKKAAPILELVKQAVNFALSGSNVRCEFFLPEDQWMVEYDGNQIQVVINSLTVNALEAMPAGGIIKVFAEILVINGKQEESGLRLQEGRYLKISIQDQGSGISEENLPKIFDPYFSTKDRGTQKGMGLGLSSVYSIIKAHDGCIVVDSKKDVGTTCHIYLPAL
ncbi:MAG: PAS domain S-box protein [Desulfobacterales bacterium]|nr:PAS domain S-box protein [Desulfobacterales bacterium]